MNRQYRRAALTTVGSKGDTASIWAVYSTIVTASTTIRDKSDPLGRLGSGRKMHLLVARGPTRSGVVRGDLRSGAPGLNDFFVFLHGRLDVTVPVELILHPLLSGRAHAAPQFGIAGQARHRLREVFDRLHRIAGVNPEAALGCHLHTGT